MTDADIEDYNGAPILPGQRITVKVINPSVYACEVDEDGDIAHGPRNCIAASEPTRVVRIRK